MLSAVQPIFFYRYDNYDISTSAGQVVKEDY